MAIFNSLGSNYNLDFIFKNLFSKNLEKYSSQLKQFLQKKYGGQVYLYYKGREAITLGLVSLGLPKESSIAINGYTCFAVYKAIEDASLKPFYLDIDKKSLNFSAETLEKALKENSAIKAVIIQNTLGFPCDIEKIANFCKEKKIVLIEDLAHCVGTKYLNYTEAGKTGDLVILSFSQDKMIDAISGGALIIRNSKYSIADAPETKIPEKRIKIDKLYPVFTYIIRKTYPIFLGKVLHSILKKINLLSTPMKNINDSLHKLPAFYCKIVLNEFEKFHSNIDHRREIAKIYSENLDKNILSYELSRRIPFSSNLRFPIFVKNRESLINYLNKKSIYISDIWYDSPIAPKKYLTFTNYSYQCPNAEIISSEMLNLPTHKNISVKAAKNICYYINQWIKSQ